MEKQELVKGIAALMGSAIATPTPEQKDAFEELGKTFAEGINQMTYDPMPSRGVRGFLQMQQAHGTREDRTQADKTFKDNCDVYEKHFGLDALVKRLTPTYIGAYAESINCPVETVSFSDALNWRSNQAKAKPQ